MPSQFKAKFYQTEEFRTLDKKWKEKLKTKGFKDIEKNENTLNLYESAYFSDSRRITAEVVQAKQAYYQIAGHFLNDYDFKSAFDRKVWAMHAEGKGIRDIAAAIKRPGLKDKIHLTIQRLEKEMINKAKGTK